MHNIHTIKFLENCIKENKKLLFKVLCLNTESCKIYILQPFAIALSSNILCNKWNLILF